MWSVHDLPIKSKLHLLTTVAVVTALTLASVAFVANDLYLLRTAQRSQVACVSSMLANNLAASPEARDRAGANKLLTSLRGLPAIQSARLLDGDGAEIAAFEASMPNAPAPTNDSAASPTIRAQQRRLTVRQPVVLGPNRIGVLEVRATSDFMTQQMAVHAAIVIGVFAAALTIALILAGWLQQLFTSPVLRLVGAMRQVAEVQDYSLRVGSHGRDELGVLCHGFNDMLDQIERARKQLQQANERLELRVARRTAELSSANAELTAAIATANAANLAKSEFLANMSHELRTPLTAILGHADLLCDEDASPAEQQESIATIRRSGTHLLTVINDILDISKIEAGKATIERISFSPCQLVAEVASSMRVRAVARKLSLQVECCEPIPGTIRSDPTRLRQVLTNLVGNALKFTEQGGVRIRIGLDDPHELEHAKFFFEVIDTGVGMTAEQLEQVFEPFTQGDSSVTRRFGGTGLGLAISRRFAEMLGGGIEVESALGVGSRFKLIVDAGALEGVRLYRDCSEALAGETLPAEPAGVLPRLDARVLLVEDGYDNQRLIARVLRKAGIDVEIAQDGQQGVAQALEALADGKPFDVILMDMQMPVMDGYSATRQLRGSGYDRPILALTAHAMRHDRQACLDAGCDDYLTKPIDRCRLLRTLMQFRDKRQPATHESTT